MNPLQKILFTGSIITIIFSSCSIEKRMYRPGYHIEWNNNNLVSEAPESTNRDQTNRTENELLKKNEILTIENIINPADNSIPLSTQKPVLFSIKQNTIIKNDPVPTAQKFIQAQEIKKKTKGKNAAGGGGKSQLVALLLCIFLGLLGIHRFYLGYYGIGIFMILTAGGCGLLYIVDIVRIATGDLEPKDDSYDKSFDDEDEDQEL